MSDNSNPVVFSVKRADLLFDYATSFSDIFRMAVFADDEPRADQGVRLQKEPGFDFQSECSPFVEVLPLSEDLIAKVGGEAADYLINITVDDFGLWTRQLIHTIGVDQIREPKRFKVDLKAVNDAAFQRGFEIKCFITRRADVSPEEHLVWNKSQQIFEASFVAKASGDEALFDIQWTVFADQEEQKEVLAYVHWKSLAVSSDIDVDCFEVHANKALQDQVTRLNNNRAFGDFCIRLIVEKIINELVVQCLKYAELSLEPQQDSLHDRIKAYLEKGGLDFDDLAAKMQSRNSLEQLQVSTDINKFVQRSTQIGSTLNAIRFGGY